MKRYNLWIALILVLATLLATACASASADVAAKPKPAVVEPIEGSEGLNRVTLTEQAAARLDVQTTAVREETVNGATLKVIPYSALIYDNNGGTWVYVSPAPLTFVRQKVTIDSIEGDTAVVADGLDVGTEVAAVGVAELYGTDVGITK